MLYDWASSTQTQTKNVYVVNTIGKDNLTHLLSVANVLHCMNPLDVEEDWISDYALVSGNYDITP